MDYRKEIDQFVKQSTKPILLLRRTSTTNPILEWSKLRHPVKTFFNAFVIGICKYLPPERKNSILRMLTGMSIGENVGISTPTDFDIFYPELISIEDNVIIGWGVHILCHELTQQEIRIGRVRIGKNAVVGAFSTIRCGVTIGKNSIVAMNSFVNKNIPNGEIWGGVPARKIRDAD